MRIEFEKTMKRDKATGILRNNAIVDGRSVECRAGPDALICVSELAEECGFELKSDAERACALRPYWEAGIRGGRFDDDARVTITLPEEELLDYLVAS